MASFFEDIKNKLLFLGPEQDLSLALPRDHDPSLVGLSILIAVFASYAACVMAAQARQASSRAERMGLTAGSALALGGGTWAMHFLGMLAWQPTISVNYDLFLTAISALPAIAASGISLIVISLRGAAILLPAIYGGVLMGIGIGLMHYTGMAALKLEAVIYYDLNIFILSLFVAIFFSIAGLYQMSRAIRTDREKRHNFAIFWSALLMGIAISIMHYTGMAASFCFSTPLTSIDGAETRYLAVIVTLVAASLLTFAVIATQNIHRLRMIPILTREIEKRRKAEQQLMINREALRQSHDALEERVATRTKELSSEIAERKRVEVELLHAMNEAEKATRAKSAFLSNMSHELRTPLNGIIGYLELLTTDQGKIFSQEKVQSIVADVHGASTHLLSLINDVLDMSRIEAGMEDVHPEALDVASRISGSIEVVQFMADKKEIDIVVADFVDPILIYFDERHFRQALINILSNGINYTNPGGHIFIEAKVDPDGLVMISIRDTGVGIPQNDVARVFGEFERTENAMVASHSGTGLGLPLTKKLVEMNGGTIHLESDFGQGTTVVITCRASHIASHAQGTRLNGTTC
ncbi:MAG: hypothetical protein HQ483_18570 [Rhodospirillales bacterium]|nr:hypothetical protein [Rhodospirillales bacterium]